MTRVFLISGSEEQFRTKLADFIEDKEIKNRKSKITFDDKVKLLLNSKSGTENKVRIIEELAELQKEIAKDLRNCLTPETRVIDYENILEEFADVVIELHMLKEIYYIDDEILEKAVNEKMEKNLNRIGIYRNPTTL